jgi:hypothetical protein
VIHHWICKHRIEIEVTPAQAEVNYRDEAYVDPLNTQIRFVATVYNAPSNRVKWMVINGSGQAGAGSIDADGLYTAPTKGTKPYAMTDIAVAVSQDDPTRKAYALVNLVGFGPEIQPEPTIMIYPRTVYAYYRGNVPGTYNQYIDPCNKEQMFQTIISDSDSDQVIWRRNGSPVGSNDRWYLFVSDWSGQGDTILLTAQLMDHPAVSDTAIIRMINYHWPGIS